VLCGWASVYFVWQESVFGLVLAVATTVLAWAGLHRGSVLAPSTRWYWEGAPQDVVGAGIIRAVNCLPGVAGVLKYRPRVEHQAVLSGNVTAFNVQRKNGLRFVAGVRLEIWTRDARRLVASHDFATETPIAAETPEAIADAASLAVSRLAVEAAAWLTADSGGPLAQCFAESAK